MRSFVIRAALLLGLVFLVAACGQNAAVPKHKTYYGIWLENLPQQRTYYLGWTESAPNAALLRVHSLEVGPRGWKAQVSFTNISHQNLLLPTGGKRSPIDFGLGVFTDSLSPRLEDPGNYLIYAKTITPALPKVLKPGQRWAGTFSSPAPPRASRYLRLVFGVFFWQGKPPANLAPFFLWVTSHGVQSPPRQGTAATTTGS